jgi:hypothetical protein
MVFFDINTMLFNKGHGRHFYCIEGLLRSDFQPNNYLLVAFRSNHGVETTVKACFIRKFFDINLLIAAGVEDGTWVFIKDGGEELLKDEQSIGYGLCTRKLNVSARSKELGRDVVRRLGHHCYGCG